MFLSPLISSLGKIGVVVSGDIYLFGLYICSMNSGAFCLFIFFSSLFIFVYDVGNSLFPSSYSC